MKWSNQKVLVTGGCSFIGSHLTEALAALGADVRVVDDLSSGRVENLEILLATEKVELLRLDLMKPGAAERAVEGVDYVFHLAANHGGRGYVDRHQALCAANLALDALMIRASHRAGVKKFVFASSGGVYPTDLGTGPDDFAYLTEEMAGPRYQPDGLQGWAKLATELSLQAYQREYGLASVSLRYFAAFGERCPEHHGIIAMIARAFLRQDPFIVWGTGEQVRSWTYVSDIVAGTILAAERVEDARPINLGTMERVRVIDAAREILRRTGVPARIQRDPSKPTGPYNRVAHNGLARHLLGWTPKVGFSEGLDRTLKWYFETKRTDQVHRRFERLLVER
jgi:UDP-glucose 4-epimerase